MNVRTLHLLPLALLAFAVAGLLSACSHYQLGTGGKLAFSTLFIAPVDSTAPVPQARPLVGANLREAFLRDGRVQLVDSPAAADAVLHITLVGYRREATVASQTDPALARKFNLILTAECTLTLHDGTVLFSKRKIEVSREDYVDQGQLQAEYNMLPHLADLLSNQVLHATLDVW